jgi:Na+-driven multidrug efflux pump
MRTVNIANAREIIAAYGQSSSAWAASTINTWIGVILGVVVLVSAIPIIRHPQKEESQKVKSVALLFVAAIIAGAAVMMFINNKYGNVVGHATDTIN